MKKNITLSAEENLIEKARRKARKEDTTLNNEFRRWLQHYIEEGLNEQSYKVVMSRLSYADAGRKFSRQELNER